MITKEQLKKIYNLAKLELDENNIDKLIQKFSAILEFSENLMKLDTSGVNSCQMLAKTPSILREDNIEDSLKREEVIAQSKETEFGYFKIKNTTNKGN